MFDYITRFNAFLDRSMGTLDQGEVAVYVRLFQLNNNYRRVEWFGVLNVNLAELAGMSEKTLIKTRNSLKQKGYIDFIQGKKGCKTRYKLLPIENELENLQHNYSTSTVNLQHNYSTSTVEGTDLIKDKDKDKGIKRTRKVFTPPTLEEVRAYITEKNLSVSADKFFAYYEAGSWHDSKGNPVKNWKQKCLTWERQSGGQVQQRPAQQKFFEPSREELEAMEKLYRDMEEQYEQG